MLLFHAQESFAIYLFIKFKITTEADKPLDMKFVRKHALIQAEELNVSLRVAAARVILNQLVQTVQM